MTSGLQVFDSTLQKTHVWLNDIMDELRWPDRHRAYLALRAVLHALRDRLTLEETAQFGAQLPMLVRGIYYEGWQPGDKPLRERRLEDFLEHVRQNFQNVPDVNAEEVTRAVFLVIARHVTAGEVSDVKKILPEAIRTLWP